MTKIVVLAIVFLIAILASSPSLADKGCFKQGYIDLWSEKYAFERDVAKQIINSTEMPNLLGQIYDAYIDKLMMSSDSSQITFELFSLNWDVTNYHQGNEDYELVPKALRECVKWMWDE